MKPVQIKLVTKLSGGGGIPPSDWSSLKKSTKQGTGVKKAPLRTVQASTLAVPPPPPRKDVSTSLGVTSPHRISEKKEKEKRLKSELALQQQVRRGIMMHKRSAVISSDQVQSPGLLVRSEGVTSLKQPESGAAVPSSANPRMSDYSTATNSADPRISDYMTRIKEQEGYLKLLRQRVDDAERLAQIERGRAEETQHDAQKFLTSWSRAVKTLELIRESGIYLDDRLERAIRSHCAALQSHEKSSIYAPKQGDLNPPACNPEPLHFSPSRRPTRSHWEEGNLDLGLTIAREGALAYDSTEARSSEELPVATRMSLDSLSGSGKSIFGDSLLGFSFPDM